MSAGHELALVGPSEIYPHPVPAPPELARSSDFRPLQSLPGAATKLYRCVAARFVPVYPGNTMKPEQCTAEIKLWVPPTLRDKVELAAAAEGRSLSNMTRRILERWVAEQPSGRAA